MLVKAVTLNNLTSQLRRDVTANPKKAAALGLMVVVALYFWGPLAWKFMQSSGGKQKKDANLAALILTDDPVETNQAGKGSTRSRFRWEKVRQLMHDDPYMRSAAFNVAWIDPFAKPARETTPEPAAVEAPMEDPSAVSAAMAASVQPESLGFVLGGIIIGQRNRYATINGEPCREGDLISITDKSDKSAAYEFRVVKINRQSVQLEMAGRIFTLELAKSQLGAGDEFDRGRLGSRE
jgi:hypothetical protein